MSPDAIITLVVALIGFLSSVICILLTQLHFRQLDNLKKTYDLELSSHRGISGFLSDLFLVAM